MGSEKLLISGSSIKQAYLLQIDLATSKSDTLIYLLNDPFRHAGGFQVSGSHVGIGIEDNYTKTKSKVCLYNFENGDLQSAKTSMVIERNGIAKKQTAGSVGLLALNISNLMVVSNWDSRNWDFYSLNFINNQYTFLRRFNAPKNWGSYQSINLISDNESIYAIGFYSVNSISKADLILVSKLVFFEPIMKQLSTKVFHCSTNVDFSGAAGLQVDENGKLHIWASQKDASKQIILNRFSEE